jgi:hypothetical protein
MSKKPIQTIQEAIREMNKGRTGYPPPPFIPDAANWQDGDTLAEVFAIFARDWASAEIAAFFAGDGDPAPSFDMYPCGRIVMFVDGEEVFSTDFDSWAGSVIEIAEEGDPHYITDAEDYARSFRALADRFEAAANKGKAVAKP